MTFLRGASLTTAETLGHAATADIGPTAGNGFDTRWSDDLISLRDIGLSEVRITLDWARLQPQQNIIDHEWAERFEQILSTSASIGLRPWACLHEESIPRWFDNHGGFGDDEAVIRWWPRWVERAADRFGDLVAGWLPFASIPAGIPEQPWIDTWGILDGGPPVVACVDLRDRADTVDRFVGQMDLLGAVLDRPSDGGDMADAATLARCVDRWGGEIRESADSVDNVSLVACFGADHHDSDVAGDIVAAWRDVLDDACSDGVPIELAFLEPAIAGPDSSQGVLDTDRTPTPSSTAFLD